jgi:hypothetical protein
LPREVSWLTSADAQVSIIGDFQRATARTLGEAALGKCLDAPDDPPKQELSVMRSGFLALPVESRTSLDTRKTMFRVGRLRLLARDELAREVLRKIASHLEIPIDVDQAECRSGIIVASAAERFPGM